MTRLPAVGFRRQARRALMVATSTSILAACTASATSPRTTTQTRTSAVAEVSPSSRPSSSTPPPEQAEGFEVSRVQSHDAWSASIGRTIGSLDVSVAIGIDRKIVYAHLGDLPRVLASNEKLLTSMAALELLGPSFRFETRTATSARVKGGVLRGDLWLIGGGDPTLTYDDLAALATRVREGGVTRVTGDVVGDTSAFDRGWWAPGWLRGISRQYVTRPTALRLDGGDASPEPEAVAAFRAALLSAGIAVGGGARVGAAPTHVRTLATVPSPALHSLLAHQNHESDNLYAELTTKFLAAEHGVASTASGAAVIERWAERVGVETGVRDGSGLSDQDETSAIGMVTLLLAAQHEPWFSVFERSLPAGGEGTLSLRLVGVPVRAKTGTLFIRPASTLSGYVTTRAGTQVAFSVLTHDLPEGTAVSIEDTIVRILAAAPIR
ncbi:MAG: D-alanyl-D-alanine carboxypeptidase [Actinomycetota bacterium]|nr:D-alanyl-D-alanine carboxypeptidase [Actinomycetota bacterium]